MPPLFNRSSSRYSKYARLVSSNAAPAAIAPIVIPVIWPGFKLGLIGCGTPAKSVEVVVSV